MNGVIFNSLSYYKGLDFLRGEEFPKITDGDEPGHIRYFAAKNNINYRGREGEDILYYTLFVVLG